MILFETVRWKNILSTGNSFTEIRLDKSPNTLIIGHNGAGKSTILDALCFGLFGKPFRKINKPNILNSINGQKGLVEVEFTIGKKKYKIVRGIKPNIFEIYCDGTLINQDAASKDYQEVLEKQILKLNFKSFTQVVILGSASFVPFMQLSAADRRGIIEDLLDIQIFSTMNGILKEKYSENKDELTKIKYDISLVQEKINLQLANIEEHKKNNTAEIEKKSVEIGKDQDQIKKLQSDCELIQKHIDAMSRKVEDKIRVEEKSKEYYQLETKLETRLKRLKKDEVFYTENDSCPTCKQSIPDTFKKNQLDTLVETKSEVESALKQMELRISSIQEHLSQINKTQSKISLHQSEVVKYHTNINALYKNIGRLIKEIAELNTKSQGSEENNQKLTELKEELALSRQSYETLLKDKQYMEFAGTLLKDGGIKTRIIKQYLPIMNKLINKYLKAMDFFVNFNIDENFNETIKSRHRDDFSYANFSEGEKMRIDLALLFTWRQVAKLKNSVSTNLLILDEVFDSSLDTVGTEEFLKLIHEMGTDTNVFVISHKGDQLFDKFRSVIKFQKVNNFSQVVK
jgi:DNA repair exonuclease SbcCD ATPase subunit